MTITVGIFPKGYLVAGRYKIERTLGVGGMGTVYVAKDTMLGEENVAIKILHQQHLSDASISQRFLREVQLMRKVSHQNVVRTYDVGKDQDTYFFTMELLPGTPLNTILESGNFSKDFAGEFLLQTLYGIDAIHRADIIHRDLKPANIIIVDNKTVKITDFGVARPTVSQLTSPNELIGSIHYLAPEIWIGKEPGFHVDFYSLGVIMYEILTGQQPFTQQNPSELMWSHLKEVPKAPSEVAANVPPWLSEITLKLLAKEPLDRGENVQELITFVENNLGITTEARFVKTGASGVYNQGVSVPQGSGIRQPESNPNSNNKSGSSAQQPKTMHGPSNSVKSSSSETRRSPTSHGSSSARHVAMTSSAKYRSVQRKKSNLKNNILIFCGALLILIAIMFSIR